MPKNRRSDSGQLPLKSPLASGPNLAEIGHMACLCVDITQLERTLHLAGVNTGGCNRGFACPADGTRGILEAHYTGCADFARKDLQAPMSVQPL